MSDLLRSHTETIGRDDATPAAQITTPPRIAVAEDAPPSILRVQTAAEIAQAKALGFNFLLLPHMELLPEALPEGFFLLLEIDLTHPGTTALPCWETKLAACQAAGIAGFYARAAHGRPPSLWQPLLATLRAHGKPALCIAEVFGANPAEIAALAGAGFDYVTSSSCWWDFSAAWLNADSARLAAIAPLVSHAAPPGATGWSKAATLRALRFSAAFAPAWLVDSGFILRPGLDLAEDIRALNALRREYPALRLRQAAQLRSSPGSAVALLARAELVIAANPALDRPAVTPASAAMPALGTALLAALGEIALPLTPASAIRLEPGETRFFEAALPDPILLAAPTTRLRRPAHRHRSHHPAGR